MNLLGTPTDKDAVARKIIDEISRANALTAESGPKPEWVDVQVRYRLKDTGYSVREAVLQQQAVEVPEILSRLARHVKLAYGQMSVEALTTTSSRRIVTFDIADLLCIEISSEPHTPPQNDEDIRRSRFRGHGSTATPTLDDA